MSFFNQAYGGTLEPSIWFYAVVLLVPSLTALCGLLVVSGFWDKAHCALFHRKHRALWHTADGDFIKCSKCGLVRHL